MPNTHPKIEKILESAIQRDSSDIHLVVGAPPVLRIHGKLVRLDTAELTAEDLTIYMKSLTPENFQTQLGESGSCNYSLEFHERAFRVNVCQERRGLSLVLRLIAQSVKTPEQLGIANSVVQAVGSHNGLVLVTGATGSGKSTTLASLVDLLTRTAGLRIVTIEQPIEFRFKHNGRSLVTQREVPLHTRDFSDAVIDALRQDPDVLMIGELRSYHEMRVAIAAAETGHLVLSTLHTNSAAESVDRFIGSFPSDEQNLIRMQFSTALKAIVSQSLVPTSDGTGRVMVHEVLCNNPAIANLIRKGDTNRITSTIQTSSRDGMLMFDDHLLERVRMGMISAKDAILCARDSQQFQARVRALPQEDDE